MVNLLTRAFAGRTVHVVADALYRGPAWPALPDDVTFTTRLHAKAVLYAPPPPPSGKRGHPAWKGSRLGTPAQIAAATTWAIAMVTCYGEVRQVLLADIRCLWWASLHGTATRLVLLRDPAGVRPDLALITTDLRSPAEAIVASHADRWSIEQTIKDGKDLLGVGDAQNRLKTAVERTAPFMFLTLTILVCWYAALAMPRLTRPPGEGWPDGTGTRNTSVSPTCSSRSAGPE